MSAIVLQDANSKILQQLVDLRRKKATLLGYETHAAYIHEMRMAKNPQNVQEFLASLTGITHCEYILLCDFYLYLTQFKLFKW